MELNTEWIVKFVSAEALEFALREYHLGIANPELIEVRREEAPTVWGEGTQEYLVAQYRMPQWDENGCKAGELDFKAMIPLFRRHELGLYKGIPGGLEEWAAAPWAFDITITDHPNEGDGYYLPDEDFLYQDAEQIIEYALAHLPAATFDPKARAWMIGDHLWEMDSSKGSKEPGS